MFYLVEITNVFLTNCAIYSFFDCASLLALIKYIRPVFVSRSDQNSRKKTVEEIKRRAHYGGDWPQVSWFTKLQFRCGLMIPQKKHLLTETVLFFLLFCFVLGFFCMPNLPRWLQFCYIFLTFSFFFQKWKDIKTSLHRVTQMIHSNIWWIVLGWITCRVTNCS